jgi:hypothetical protein
MLTGCVAFARAQQIDAARTATVRIVVVDSSTDRPIRRVGIQVTGRLGVAFTDSTGGVAMSGLSLGPEIRLRCPPTYRLSGPVIRLERLSLHRDTSIVFRIDATKCVEPPIQHVHGEFRGLYTPGFESSDFTPCDGFSPSLKPPTGAWAWVSFSKSVDLSKVQWPRVADTTSYPTYYVRWEGTLSGPAAYGHMGAADFDLFVDRILELRAQAPGDCR